MRTIVRKPLIAAALLAGLATPSAAQTPPLRVEAGFAPIRLALAIHAEDGLGTMENDCVGYVQRTPVLVFEIAADSAPGALEARLDSGTDTVLAVVQPHERRWGGGMPGPEYCSDDEGGGVNPAVVMRDLKPGRYQVLAGAHAAGATVEAVLTLRDPDAP